MEERVKKIMAEILGIEQERLVVKQHRTTVKEWDSLKHMQLILAPGGRILSGDSRRFY